METITIMIPDETLREMEAIAVEMTRTHIAWIINSGIPTCIPSPTTTRIPTPTTHIAEQAIIEGMAVLKKRWMK